MNTEKTTSPLPSQSEDQRQSTVTGQITAHYEHSKRAINIWWAAKPGHCTKSSSEGRGGLAATPSQVVRCPPGQLGKSAEAQLLYPIPQSSTSTTLSSLPCVSNRWKKGGLCSHWSVRSGLSFSVVAQDRDPVCSMHWNFTNLLILHISNEITADVLNGV